MAGVLLSFGGLLSQVVSAGSPGLTASNPGLVKLLSGFVFPVGLVMCVSAVLFISSGIDCDLGLCYKGLNS